MTLARENLFAVLWVERAWEASLAGLSVHDEFVWWDHDPLVVV